MKETDCKANRPFSPTANDIPAIGDSDRRPTLKPEEADRLLANVFAACRMSGPTSCAEVSENVAAPGKSLYKSNALFRQKTVFRAVLTVALLFCGLYFLPGVFSGKTVTRLAAGTDREGHVPGPALKDFHTENDLVYLNILDTGTGIDFDGLLAVDLFGQETKPCSVDEPNRRIAFRIPASPITVTIPDQADHALKLLISPQK